jgi:TetR/AcrR family transcriptional regulator, copper-responsive repressor
MDLKTNVKSFIMIDMKDAETPKRKGRPPAFDRAHVLDAAMRQFWQKGYEGTSMADLSQAMRMNPPSIYGAFGDKKSLFEESIKTYQAGVGCFAQKALEDEKNPRAAIKRLLMEAAANFTSRKHPRGCMVVLSALNCSDEDAEVGADLAKLRNRSTAAIAAKIAEADEQGGLPQSMPPDVIANIVVTVFQGMSIRARDGATRQELEAVVQQTMQLWPEQSS